MARDSSSRGSVISTHHRAKVSQIDLVDVGERGIGTVTPLSGADLGQHLLSQREEALRRNLRLALRLQGLVLRRDCLTHRGKTSGEELLRNRHLLGREAREQCLTVHATCAQPLGLRLRLGSDDLALGGRGGRGVRVRCGRG